MLLLVALLLVLLFFGLGFRLIFCGWWRRCCSSSGSSEWQLDVGNQLGGTTSTGGSKELMGRRSRRRAPLSRGTLSR